MLFQAIVTLDRTLDIKNGKIIKPFYMDKDASTQ